MENYNRAELVLQALRQCFKIPAQPRSDVNHFETLVSTIISQNTTGSNARRAFQKLSNKFQINAEILGSAKISDLEDCLKTAGLYRNKAKFIRQVSREISRRNSDYLKQVLALPLPEARERLMQLSGVGPKTADVVLLFSGNKFTIPVDTHVARVSKKLGFVDGRAGYEEIRETLQSLFRPRDYLPVHVLFISLGRKHCKARKPLCACCSLSTLCPSCSLRKAS